MTTFIEEHFMKWGFLFIGPIKLARRLIGYKYIIVITNYAIKWVEAKALKTSTIVFIARFMYEYIFIKFGCPFDHNYISRSTFHQ